MQAILSIMKKFEETGVVTNVERPVQHRFAHSAENISVINEYVNEDPNVSNPSRSQELGLAYGTLWRTLHLYLHLHPYTVQLAQQLKPTDYSQPRRYVEWILERQAVDGNFLN